MSSLTTVYKQRPAHFNVEFPRQRLVFFVFAKSNRLPLLWLELTRAYRFFKDFEYRLGPQKRKANRIGIRIGAAVGTEVMPH